MGDVGVKRMSIQLINRSPDGTLLTDLNFSRKFVVSLIYDGVFVTTV